MIPSTFAFGRISSLIWTVLASGGINHHRVSMTSSFLWTVKHKGRGYWKFRSGEQMQSPGASFHDISHTTGRSQEDGKAARPRFLFSLHQPLPAPEWLYVNISTHSMHLTLVSCGGSPGTVGWSPCLQFMFRAHQVGSLHWPSGPGVR